MLHRRKGAASQIFRMFIQGVYLRLAFIAALVIPSASGLAQSLVVWGSNTSGQTNVPPPATNLVSVAAGLNHSLVLREDGVVIAWGNNSAGQATVPESATNAVAIAAGGNHSMALRSDGSVVVWGNTANGLTTVPSSVSNVVSIAAGDLHCLALRSDGRVVAWGNNLSGQTTVPVSATNVVAIAAGRRHGLALKNDGTVVGWGALRTRPRVDDVNAIASGGDKNILIRAGGMLYTSGTAAPPSATNVVAVAAGTNSCLALKADGQLVAWGTGPSVNVPTTATNIIAVAVGASHGLALRGDGQPRMLGGPRFADVVSSGDPMPLAVRAVGQAPLHYQWLADGVPVPDTDAAYPKITAGAGTDHVSYQAIVSNALGMATSSPVRVSVRTINAWGDNVVGQRRIADGTTNSVAIVSGAFHALALNPDGTVSGWGKNSDGQADVPADATNIVAIAAGGDHSVALRDDGSVRAWGRNWDGQTNVPPSATNAVAVAAGWAHSVALKADGTVVAWGNNEYDQTDVSALVTEVTAIAAGYFHNLALKADGTVVSWGWDTLVPPAATNVISISAGWGHSLALKADGSVVAWGDNSYGQTNVPPSATNIVGIAASYFHSMALRADGSVVAWGKGYFGSTNVPARLANVTAIAAGEHFSLALVGSGQPRFYRQRPSVLSSAGGMAILNGSLDAGISNSLQWFHEGVAVSGATNRNLVLRGVQLSDAGSYTLVVASPSGMLTNQPTSLTVQPDPTSYSAIQMWGDDANRQLKVSKGVSNPKAIAAGAFHSLALNTDGTVVGWGKSLDGRTNVPPFLTNVVAVAAGGDHSLALKDDGSVRAWGRNWDGQTNVPPSATNITAIAAGWAHSLALRNDGRVIAWGNNEYGQISTPPFLSNVMAIAAGYYHSLALLPDRTVVSWGLDDRVPVSATNVVALAAGWRHSLALRGDGSVVAWGDNTYGQCDVPASATNVVSISGGYAHSFALLADGTGVAWGKGFFGATNIPTGLRNVSALAAGENHGLALVELGPPRFNHSPAQVVTHVGGLATLSARVTGTRPLALQWFHEGSPVIGATAPWLLLSGVPASAAGTYSLVASNAVAVSTQFVSLITRPEPSLDKAPSNRKFLVGVPARLDVAASGAGPLNYRWQRDGVDVQDGGRISGATSPTLCFDPAEYGDSGEYVVVVNNAYGSVTGLVASVVVTPVIAWGNNSFGQLDMPTSASNVVALATGEDHSLALRADGTIVAWGDSSFGQTSVPASATNVVAIAASGRHSTAMRADGTIIGWGSPYLDFSVSPSATNVVAIADGFYNLALRADGTVLTLPQTFQGNVPVSATNVVGIAAGSGGSYLVKADGSVAGVGFAVPSRVTNVVQVAPGGLHLLALRADGTVLDWRTSRSTVPAEVTNIVAISSGLEHSLALRADGSVVAWGIDYFGQVQVPGSASNIVAVSAGETHSLALSSAGQSYLSTSFVSEAISVGSPFLLRSFASGQCRVSYQWRLNGVDVPGATNRSLLLGGVYWTNTGSYSLVTSNGLGSVTNPPINLTINRPPLVFDGSASALTEDNGSFRMRLLGATGFGPLVLYASTNLSDWTPVFTNQAMIGPVDFETPLPPLGVQFFRASEEKGP